MKRNPCVLIPAYNEERTVGGIVRQIRGRDFTVYVIDDGSVDRTSAEASAAGAIVMTSAGNMGKGAAMRSGFNRIIADGRFDSIIVMDGDGQHEVQDIANFIEISESEGADLVIGNRMDDVSKMPKIRILTNRFMSWLLSVMTGNRIPDTQCGFRLIDTSLLRKLDLVSSKYDIDSEMILKAARSGAKIVSAPIKTVYRNEKSKINPFVDTLRFIRLLLFNAFQ